MKTKCEGKAEKDFVEIIKGSSGVTNNLQIACLEEILILPSLVGWGWNENVLVAFLENEVLYFNRSE